MKKRICSTNWTNQQNQFREPRCGVEPALRACCSTECNRKEKIMKNDNECQFTASFSVFATLKRTFFFAGIAMASPVLGFRPVRSSYDFTLKVPNCLIRTSAPSTNASRMTSNASSSTISTSLFAKPVRSAVLLIKSCLLKYSAPIKSLCN